jgi:hypothetical protein
VRSACLIAVVVALAAGGAAPAPGKTGAPTPPLAALGTLPKPRQLPVGYLQALERSAPRAGVSPVTAALRTRVLLSDVTGLPLYAFAGSRGRVCFLLWRGVGTCGAVNSEHKTLWAVNGGSRKRGQAVVGVVANEVRAVDVWIDGRRHRVRVRHNAFSLPFRSHVARSPRVVPVTR